LQDQLSATQPNKTVVIIGIIIAAVFPSVAMELFGRLHIIPTQSLFYSRFIFWGEVLFLWWYAEQYENQKLIIWKEKESGVNFITKWVCFLFLLAMAANILSAITKLLGFPENYPLMRAMAKFLADKPFLIIFISATAGFCEEVIFRGYILTRLTSFFKNEYIPVIISAVLFSAMHYKYHSAREFVFTFLFAMITGLHYNYYRNIKPLIIVHFLVDWAALSLLHHFVK